jgi:serine protease inhibitor
MHASARCTLQVLTNALYFKSTWEYPFDKSRTRAYAFTTSEKEGGKVGDVTHSCMFDKLQHQPQHTACRVLRAISETQLCARQMYCTGTRQYTPNPSVCPAATTCCFLSRALQKFDVQMMTRLFNPRELRGTQPVSFSSVPGKYEAIRLPYKGSPGLSAVFVLPSSDTFATVADAAKQISAQMALDGKAWALLSEPLALSLPSFRAEVKQLRLKEVCPGSRAVDSWLGV